MATIARPCLRMNLDLLESSASGVDMSFRSSSVIASRSISRSDSASSSTPRNVKLKYQSQATLRTIFPKKLDHSSRVGGLDDASRELLFPSIDLSREIERRGEGDFGAASPSPRSFPSIPASGMSSPELNSGGTSVPSPLRISSDGNGSEIPSSLPASSELVTRGSVGSSPRASAASGVIPFPVTGTGTGWSVMGNHYFPGLLVNLLRTETLVKRRQ